MFICTFTSYIIVIVVFTVVKLCFAKIVILKTRQKFSTKKTSNIIRNAFRFKDQTPKYINSKVICKFMCNICNDIYIQTKRHFLVHEYEHFGKSILTEKNLKYAKKYATAIRRHCYNHCHTADTSCFLLIGKAANKYHLKLKESLLI